MHTQNIVSYNHFTYNMSENQANTLLNASVLKNKHKRNIAINILVFILRNVLQN